jgi:hypothetical protein
MNEFLQARDAAEGCGEVCEILLEILDGLFDRDFGLLLELKFNGFHLN